MPHMNVHDLGRLKEIATVLVRNGFGHLVQGTPFEVRGEAEDTRLPLPVRVRQVFVELGPTFVKLGQVLSVRPDIIPAAFLLELQTLQDKVEPEPFERIKEVLETEWGVDLDEHLQSIEEAPLASASIAQVHRAVLRDGRTAAIKVQRPDIESRIRSDLHILYSLAHVLTGRLNLPGFYTPVGVVQEFEAALNLELDFLQESKAIRRFQGNFADHPDICAPEVYDEWTTRRVLVLELLSGRPLSDVDPSEHEIIEPVMDKIIEATYLQIFEHGFFHGDPHPGNLMLMEDGRLAFLDFGVTGILTGNMQDTLMNLFVSLVYQDAESVAMTLFRAGATEERVDLQGFTREVERLITVYHGASLAELTDKGSLMDFVEIASRYRIRLVTEFAVLARAVSLLDGVVRRFMPEMDIVDKVSPYAQQLFGQRLGPERLGRDALKLLQQAQFAVKELPMQMNQLIMDLQTGNLDVGIVDRDAEHLQDEIRWAGVRIALAMCAGAAGVSGAYLIAPFNKVFIREIPIVPTLGLLLVVVSAAMFMGLVMHTLFAARIHPRDWFRRGIAVIRFFLPGKGR